MTNNISIFGFGCPFYDRQALVPEQFLIANNLPKGKTAITDKRSDIDAIWEKADSAARSEQWTLGGSGTNVMKMLAHLGDWKVYLCGVVGDDEVGREVQQRLNEIGINSLLSTVASKETGRVNCFITPSPECERTMQTFLGACGEFSYKNIHEEDCKDIGHFHLEGYMVGSEKVFETALNFAKKYHATTSLDLGAAGFVEFFREQFLEYYSRVDLLFGNIEEIKALAHLGDLAEAVSLFPLSQTVVATAGSEGCYVKASGERSFRHFAAIQVEKVVDPTGAGDSFAGAYINGYLQGKEPDACVKMGNLAASKVIRHIGTDLPKAEWETLTASISLI